MTSKHVYGMFSVLSSPLNHTQTNQNKVMPSTYRREFENKLKNMEKENKTNEKENKMHPNIYGKLRRENQNIGIQYIHSYNVRQSQPFENGNGNGNANVIKTRTITNGNKEVDINNVSNLVGVSRHIHKNLGWGSNRFFSLSSMRNGGGCGCG